MAVFNEADIIVPSLKYLVDQGIGVYIIDNWSTDETFELAKKFVGKGLVGIERFPVNGPPDYFNLKDILKRVEKLSQELDADWFIRQDCDEIRTPPWSDSNLKDAIYAVDKSGYNAIDHTVIDFHPVDNDFKSGSDFEKYFKYFEFGKRTGHFIQIKAWKKIKEQILLTSTGGHQTAFKGRQIYPYKFLLKHYPIRSQKHGEKKVILERIPRWDPAAKAIGWHVQYDSIHEGHNFLYSPTQLEFFDEDFHKKYLIEIISGVGINRQSK